MLSIKNVDDKNADGRPLSRSSSRTQRTEMYVGRRIRERRILLGLTQQQLADLIGVTYQQAHKYERGVNRVSAGRLYEIARVLGVDVDYFFEGLEEGNGSPVSERQRMCLDVARNFARIRDERQQQTVSQLCRILAEPS